jgi:hypothetical protein
MERGRRTKKESPARGESGAFRKFGKLQEGRWFLAESKTECGKRKKVPKNEPGLQPFGFGSIES